MQEVTRENIGKPMGMILFEKGKGEVLTIATIQSEFGSKFQITGQPTTERDRKSTRLNSSHSQQSRMPSSA